MNSSSRRISIVLADDHPIVLRGLRELLAGAGDFDIIACSPNGTDCMKEIRARGPDVALVDIAMLGMSGLEILTQVNVEKLRTRIVFLTASCQDADLAAAASAGAHGLLLKDTDSEELLRCLRKVHAGRKQLPTDLLEAALAREQERRLAEQMIDEALTARERQILYLLADGQSNKQIAFRLKLSEGTVKIHLHHVYQKLGVSSRTALLAFVHSAATLSRQPSRRT